MSSGASFLLLLPRAILSDPVGTDYDHYIHEAHRHYQFWLDITSSFNWPTERSYVDTTTSSTHSYDSRPEADIHLDDVFEPMKAKLEKCCTNGFQGNCNNECQFSQRLILRSRDIEVHAPEEEFDEGPFLRMLFKLLSNLPLQPYQVNLHLTAIISKLALMPHPNLHEYLLNPFLSTAKKTQTLFKVIQAVAKRLTMEIPRIRNYTKTIENTRLQLDNEDPSCDDREHRQLVESLIVLEEFCKELAAIAFVKYQHSLHIQQR